MPRSPTAPSRMEILLLTSLARAPMHGYELKLELAYKHVKWWAKCEHGHVYAALARLERGKFIRRVPGTKSNQRVFAITASGRKRLTSALATLGHQPDATYFDIDMFLSGCHALDRSEVIEILLERRRALVTSRDAAVALTEVMRAHVPAVGMLIMEHRVDHLTHEIAFIDRSVTALRAEPTWGPFLGETRIEEFVARSRVPLER